MKLEACNRADCFQNLCGYCKLLNETYDSPENEECKFFKTNDEVDRGRIDAHNTLIKKGLKHLIEQYEYNPQRRGIW